MADSTRDRIVEVSVALLTQGGREAVSTRAVSAAAGVQAPTIYRLFGDKQGLLDAVASHGFASYLRDKAALVHTDDPVEDLRRGWDLHVGFGLEHPTIYKLIYGDPVPGVDAPAAREAQAVLAGQIHRIARTGRLRVTEERAVHLVHAAGCGMTLTLIGLGPDRLDLGLSRLARESVISTITAAPVARTGGTAGVAAALRTALPEISSLSRAELMLLDEWLVRIAAG